MGQGERRRSPEDRQSRSDFSQGAAAAQQTVLLLLPSTPGVLGATDGTAHAARGHGAGASAGRPHDCVHVRETSRENQREG